VRRLLLVLLTLVVVAGGLSLSGAMTASGDSFPPPVPRAKCGKGSLPETGTQGRVPQSDYDSGRAAKGYRCNAKVVAHVAGTAGFKVHRYVDKKGRACAYYDSTRFFPTDTIQQARDGFGVIVLDMSNPAKPVRTATLTTPAMLSPHESLVLNQRRGLLAAVGGNAFAQVGIVDIYDLKSDCRNPTLLSSGQEVPLGHESGFTLDGKTLYLTSSGGQTFTVLDVADPTDPQVLFEQRDVNYHGLRLTANGKILYAANIGNDLSEGVLPGEGLRIFDASQIQKRVPDPELPILSNLVWDEGSIPQVAEPFVRRNHHYVLQVDEFARVGANDHSRAPVGAARIIDVHDPRRPKVISNLRLEVHQPAERVESFNDPGASSPVGGYTGHYCSIPYRQNPKLVACSMLGSGLRIFDISRLRKPREVAYVNFPGDDGSSAFAQPAWDIKRKQVWFTDTTDGLYVVKLTNGVGRLLKRTGLGRK
jgi:hypothetical protein